MEKQTRLKIWDDRYKMTTDQLAQIDCRVTDCANHVVSGCINVSPAITLREDGSFACRSKTQFDNQSYYETAEESEDIESGKVGVIKYIQRIIRTLGAFVRIVKTIIWRSSRGKNDR